MNIQIIIHVDDFFNKSRREIGSFLGIKFFADPGLPEGEVRIIEEGRVVHKFNGTK